MKVHTKLLAVGGAVALALSAGAPSAGAFDPEHQNDTAAGNCQRTVNRQEATLIATGGGPKEGLGVPTNCDKFWPPPGQQP